MANGNYKCIFMGALSNYIILRFLCNNISSTEAPGIESSGSKGNSHHAQIKVSSMISQHEHFSVKHFLSAGGVHCNTGKRRVSKHKEDCIIVLVKLVVEVMAPSIINPPHICGHHLQRVAFGQQPLCLKSLVSRIYWYHSLQMSSQEVIFCKGVQKTTGRNGKSLT